MNEISLFFLRQLDYIFFFYGFAFILLSFVCFFLYKENSGYPWIWLGIFGVLHGINEWLDLVVISLGDNAPLSIIRFIFLFLSFVSLFIFGWKLVGKGNNKKLSFLVYFIFIALALSGILFDLNSATTTVRYFLCFPGALLAAFGLYLAGKEIGERSIRRQTAYTAFFFACYGLAAGIIVNNSSIPPSNLINTESFLSFFKFPVQLLRGFLAIFISISLWRYLELTGEWKRGKSFSASRVSSSFFIAFLVFILALGWYGVNTVGDTKDQDTINVGTAHIDSLLGRINDSIEKVNQVAESISGAPWIYTGLLKGNKDNLLKAESVLKRYKKAMNVSVCYLMDRNGKTVASSNSGEPDSFVGHSYQFRPYFLEALKGGRGRYFGEGVTSKTKGYYASYPVRDPKNARIIGVVVIKKNFLDGVVISQKNTFLVDPDGKVFIYSGMAEEKEFILKISREIKNGDRTTVKGKHYFMIRLPLNVEGWSIIGFNNLQIVSEYRLFGIIIVLFICIIRILTFYFQKLSEGAVDAVYRERELFQTTITSIGDGVITTDTDLNVILLNKAAEKMTGWIEKDAAGQPVEKIFNIINEKTGEKRENPLIKALETGNVVLLANHTKLISKNGSQLVLADSAAPIFDQNKKIVGAVLVFRDITEESKRDAALRRLSAIVEDSDDAIIGKKLDGTTTSWNHAAERLYGYSESEAIGNNIALIVPDNKIDELRSILGKIKLGEHIEHFETKRKRKDGGIIDVSLMISPIKDEDGVIVGVSTIARDITERKRIEKENLELMRIKSEFTSAVSHELRTPLTLIKEGIEIVSDGTLGDITPDQKKFLTTAKRNVDRLHRLINDVLDFSKLDAGKMEMNLKPGNVVETIKEALKGAELVVKSKNLLLNIIIGENIPTVKFDPDRIIQVVDNYISNAIKFTEKGEIAVLVTKDDWNGGVKVVVKDTGIGMTKEDLPKLFEKYEQLRVGNARKTGGTGLGLAISRQIIEQHGGKVWVESEVGKGSTFYFTIPGI